MTQYSGRVPPGSIHDVIACRVRQARLSIGLSQQRLADMLGVDQGHLSRVESRKTRATVELLIAISDATGVSLNDLCGRKGQMGLPPVPHERDVLDLWERLKDGDRQVMFRLLSSLVESVDANADEPSQG